jgi:hypothetical protein
MIIFIQFISRFNKNSEAKLAEQSEIDMVELEFNIYLPDDYKSFLLTCGDLWTPDILDLIVDRDLSIEDVQDFWDVDGIIECKKNESMDGLLPFASDSMGNVFAFIISDLINQHPSASVYFYDNDFDSMEKTSESFTAWIERFNQL